MEYFSACLHPGDNARSQEILQIKDLDIDGSRKMTTRVCLVSHASNTTVIAYSRSTTEQENKGGGNISLSERQWLTMAAYFAVHLDDDLHPTVLFPGWHRPFSKSGQMNLGKMLQLRSATRHLRRDTQNKTDFLNALAIERLRSHPWSESE